MSVKHTVSALLVVAAMAVGCTASGAAATDTPAPPTAAPAASQPAASGPAASAADVAIGTGTSTTLGMYLTGPNGMTLYTHTGDTPTSSTCTGNCAKAWPPLPVPAGAQVVPASGITGTFGTLTRADGTVQVTYLGWPLYGWQGDAKAGDTTGENVNGFFVATVGGPKPAPGASIKPGY